jgi:hypothetical protein
MSHHNVKKLLKNLKKKQLKREEIMRKQRENEEKKLQDEIQKRNLFGYFRTRIEGEATSRAD